MAINNEQQPAGLPQLEAASAPRADVLARLEHLFRYQLAGDPGDRFLFELVCRYRLGESK